LERISTQLKAKNPALAEAGKQTNKVYPNIVKLGTTKTNWLNFDAMVIALDRTHEHLMNYIAAELGTEASLGPENNMIIQGNYKISIVEKLYNKYLE